jgi:hypothetical protein
LILLYTGLNETAVARLMKNKEITIRIRVPIYLQADYKKVRETCREKGINFSQWARMRLLSATERLQPLPPELLQQVVLLNKLAFQIKELQHCQETKHEPLCLSSICDRLKEITVELQHLRIEIAKLI